MRLGWVALLLVGAVGHLHAAAGVDAQWMWIGEGNPQESAPAGKVWFRRDLRVDEPSTCEITVAVDDSFVLFVNGKRFGEGKAGKAVRFNLNGAVSEGNNVLAIEANNDGGSAGLLVEGMIRGQGGSERSIDSPREWTATRTAPADGGWLAPKFTSPDWKPALGLAKHADSKWKDLAINREGMGRFWLAEGLEIEQIGTKDLAGSLVSMTWGNRGRLFVSQENGPIMVLSDANSDGSFDTAKQYSSEIKNCQGLMVVGNDLYAVGQGPDRTGLYLLPDANQDDQADAIQLINRHRGGMGEHGPHALAMGPDGKLYNCIGNHAGIMAKRRPNSPCMFEAEGYVLTPKFEDGRGHAAGIKAPGGTVWRFDPSSRDWWLETAGFRNEYDIAFNRQGELFTFDSDMEWDIGQPWYRPTRVNHCTSGAEFGWRSGAAKWPAYYFDSLPSTSDIGRGSPTGVVIYEHHQLPEKYDGSLIICDWSMGRIIAVHLDPKGASYDGSKTETLVTGNPLNVSDIEVAADGSIVFITGGRGTEGGIYRLRAAGKTPSVVKASSIKEVLDLPQLHAAWAREIAAHVKATVGDAWKTELEEVVRTGSPAHQIQALTLLSQHGPNPSTELLVDASKASDANVRAFAAWLLGYQSNESSQKTLASLLKDPSARVQRRACEAFVRSSQPGPVDDLLALLASDDRFLRFAARLALERIPSEQWKEKGLALKDDRARLTAILGLMRPNPRGISPDVALTQAADLLRSKTPAGLEALRLAQLALTAGAKPNAAGDLGEILLAQYPSSNESFDRESLRVIVKVQTKGAADKLVASLEKESNQEKQVHLALVLRYLDEGWSTDLKTRYFKWYETSKSLDGGHSFVPYLENIVSASFPRWTPAERQAMIASWKEHPYASRLLLRRSDPGKIDDFHHLIEGVLASAGADAATPFAGEIYDLAVDLLGKDDRPESRQLLRKLFEENPDRREKIASKMAERPGVEDRPLLVRSMSFASNTTLGFLLRALRRLKIEPEKPEEVRLVILSGLKMGDEGGKAAVDLLQEWTKTPAGSNEVGPAIAFYQDWFRKTYPNEPAPDLPKADKETVTFTTEQILQYIENDSRGRMGDVKHGKEIYAKAQCLKCHKFGPEGNGIGPDLTTLRRRFQKKEIIEAVLYPSQIVSDQYRTVTVVTVDGLVQTGMLASQQGQESVVLWLNNGERLEIPKGDVEEQKPSNVSLMPPGLFKDLSLQDIADLFAFLETSKSNTEPGVPANASASAASVGGGK
ncbi:HEAT repeat domain-containing protein [bacterium]|nr:HEAT repeat domain-containing protein [bacterium]